MIYAKETEKKIQFLKGAGAMFIIAAVFFIIYCIVVTNINSSKARQTLEDQQAQTVTVYMTAKPIKQGDTLNMAKNPNEYIRVNMSKSKVPKELLNYNNVDKVARIDIPAHTILTPSSFSDTDNVVTTDLRNQDYSDITLSKNLKIGDYVDIREKKKDGSDYIVVAKKKILALNGSTLVINILENERKLKNNATVDAALTGGSLYTTIYADPQNQPAADVTYQLNSDIDKMINSNPNVVSDSSKKLTSNNSTDQNQTSKPSFANSTIK